MKPLLIGEMNPYGADAHFALYPEPRGATGDRLCRLILQMSGGLYMVKFDRANLCTGRWSKCAARERWEELRRARPGGTFILLGSKVCEGVGVKFEPFTTWAGLAGTFVVLPHPSGLSRFWNDASNFQRARDTLQRAGAI